LKEVQYVNNFDSLLSFLPENITLIQKEKKKKSKMIYGSVYVWWGGMLMLSSVDVLDRIF